MLERLPRSHHRVWNVGAVPLIGGMGIGRWPRSRNIISVVENDLFLSRKFDDSAGIVIDVERDIVAGAVAQRPPDQLRLPPLLHLLIGRVDRQRILHGKLNMMQAVMLRTPTPSARAC